MSKKFIPPKFWAENLLEAVLQRRSLIRKFPDHFVWRPPCVVKLLIVTDGILDFSFGDFGLSTFIYFLQNDNRFFVCFDITLAHLSGSVNDSLELLISLPDQSNEDLATIENVLIDRSRITRHIKDFCFDKPDHFTSTMYDEVWLFGFESDYHSGNHYPARKENTNRYPAKRLGDQELINLSRHMDRGAGLFATGDHGVIGSCLCGSVKRVQNMRHWNHFPNQSNSQVGMQNEWRNDTNQPGRDSSMFGDQSDDIPQPLELKLYSSWITQSLRARYPHPVFCSRSGRIDVFPDHPHEGECRVPSNLNETYPYDSSREYPLDSNGNPLSPEIIAWSKVIAGTTSGNKDPASAQRFGAVSAYDGHRVNVGRVICDSTWHHFVNVNLIGILEEGFFQGDLNIPGVDPAKHTGFLASAAGREALAKIAEYYVNVAVWIASPAHHKCFLRGGLIITTYRERVVESSVISPEVSIATIDLKELRYIGIHARDVIGHSASQCQTLQWIITWLVDIWPEIPRYIDPWPPGPWPFKEKPLLPVFDFMHIIDIALGAALLAMRQVMPYPEGKHNDKLQKKLDNAAMNGARIGLTRALEYMDDNLKTLGNINSSFKKNDKKEK